MADNLRQSLTDTPLYRMTSVLARWVVVSVLWLVCSLPLVTLGASTAAALGVFSDGEEKAGLTGSFFRRLRGAFFPATALWLLVLAVAGLLVLDVCFYRQLTSGGSWILLGVVLLLGNLLLGFFRFGCFCIVSGEKTGFRELLKKATLTMGACLPVLAIMTAMDLSVFATLVRLPYLLVTLAILPGVFANVHSRLIRGFLRRYSDTAETP